MIADNDNSIVRKFIQLYKQKYPNYQSHFQRNDSIRKSILTFHELQLISSIQFDLPRNNVFYFQSYFVEMFSPPPVPRPPS